MRLYIIALVLILISSCQNNKQRKYLFQEDLKYSAYCWHITDSGPQFSNAVVGIPANNRSE
jgi:hypothetical protein